MLTPEVGIGAVVLAVLLAWAWVRWDRREQARQHDWMALARLSARPSQAEADRLRALDAELARQDLLDAQIELHTGDERLLWMELDLLTKPVDGRPGRRARRAKPRDRR